MATKYSSSNPKAVIRELNNVDKSLSKLQLESASFLCAAAASVRKLYGENIELKPSIQDCYSALRESRESQQNASCLLLFALSFVGCNQQLVVDLRQLMLGSQDHGPDVHGLLSDTVKQNLYLRELLHDVNESMTGEDISTFINFSSCCLKPPRNARYTQSLLVHFTNLMDQMIITPTDLTHLYEILNIMGKISVVGKVDVYYKTNSLSRDSDRHSLPSESEAASDSMVVKKESQSTKDDSQLVFVAPPPPSSKMKNCYINSGILDGPVVGDKAERKVVPESDSTPAVKGRKTRQYIVVQNNLGNIVEALQCDGRRKEALSIKFKEKSWIDPLSKELNEEALVLLALGRIERCVSAFCEFLKMLRDVVGMDQVVQELNKCR